MQPETILADILETEYNHSTPKRTSPIAQWLGVSRTPPGMSQKLGNHLEEFFSRLMCKENAIDILDIIPGTQMRGIYHKGEWHQVDILAQRGNNFITREVKTNLQLDRGKKRDTLARDKHITEALKQLQIGEVDNGIFCPFLANSKEVGGLGYVNGIEWFCEMFPQSHLTPELFSSIGKSPVIHNLLGL